MIDLNARINLEAPNDRQVVQAVNGINRSMQRGTRTAVGWADAVALKGENFAAYSIASVAIAKMSDVIGRATRDAIRFESEMAKVAQTVGKTNAEVNQSTSFIRKVSREYALSNVKIAETVKVLAQAGLSFSEAKRGADLLAKTTLLASFDSIANTTDGLIAIMKQFNLTIAQSEKALESINIVSKKYAVESADLVEAVKRTGGVFASTGGQLNELLSIFTVIRDTTRESSETIATGIRTIFTRIQRPKTIEYFRTLGIELTDLKGNFIGNYEAILRIQQGIQKLGIASESLKFSEIVEELGGIRQSSRIIPLLTQSAKLQEIYQESLKGSGEAAKDLAKAQETLEFRVNQTKQNFSNLLSEISETSSFKLLAATLIGLANALIEVGRALKQILPLFAAFGAFQLGRSFTRLAKGTAGLTPVGSGSGAFSLRGLLGYKRGGVVPGSGSGDTVPAMLEPGEFVLRKSAVNAIGTDELHNINKYAYGGTVKRLANSYSSIKSLNGYQELANKRMNYSPKYVNVVPTGIDAQLFQNMKGGYGSRFERVLANKFNLRQSSYKYGYLDFPSTVGEAKFMKKGSTYNSGENDQSEKGATEAAIAAKALLFSASGGTNRRISNMSLSLKDIKNPPIVTTYVTDPKNWIESKRLKRTPKKRSQGGSVGTDTVPSLLTPGEFVVNRESAKAFGYGNLKKINKYAKGGIVSKFAEGGEVSSGGFDIASIISFGAEVAILGGFLKEFAESTKKATEEKEKETKATKEATDAISGFSDKDDEWAKNNIPQFQESSKKEQKKLQEERAAKKEIKKFEVTGYNQLFKPGTTEEKTVTVEAKDAAEASKKVTTQFGILSTSITEVTKSTKELGSAQKGAKEGSLLGGTKSLITSGRSKLEGSRFGQAVSGNLGKAAIGAAAALTVYNKVMDKGIEAQQKAVDKAIESGDAVKAEIAARELYQKETAKGMASNLATIGGTIGTLFGPVGTVIGTLIGALLGFLTNIDFVRNAFTGFYDILSIVIKNLSFGTIDLGSFAAEEEARVDAAAAETRKSEQTKKLAAQEEESKRAVIAVETAMAKQLAQSFLEVAQAADKAKNIGAFGDLVNNLTSGNFRPTALSTGIEAGNVGSIRNAGKLAGSPRLAEQVIKNEAAAKSIEKLSAELAAGKIDEKKFRDRANEIGDEAGVGSIGDTTKEGIQEFLDKIKESGSKFKEELLKITSDSEKGFNSLLDAVDKAASAQVAFSQSLIDFGANQRGRRQELESFRVGGSTVGDIAFRRATIQTPTAASSAALRAEAVRSSTELAGTGIDIQKKAAAGGDTTKLQGNFAVLQLATKTQTELLKQDNQVRQQLIESLKESLSLEKERAGSLKDLGFGLKFGSEEEKAALATKAQQAQELEAKFRSGGVGVAVDTLAGQAESSSEAKEILSLLPAEIQQAIEKAAGVQAGGQVGGRLGADIQNVALTGFTKAGQELVTQMATQMNQQYANDLALLKIEQDNLSLLKQSAELMGAKIGDMINGFTSFGNELKNIVGSLQNASVQLTMAPANVVVTFNSPEGMDKLMGAVKQEIGREIAAQFLAREQGR